MILLPAIDIRGGRCVRLIQGDYQRETVFGNDPVAIAEKWVGQGAEWLHIVDLDGAKEGRPVNLAIIAKMVAAAKVPCQLGGGFRTEADLEAGFAAGLNRIIVGTRAIEDPDRFAWWVHSYPEKIVLGLDVKNGRPAAHGWLEEGARSLDDLLADVKDLPLAGIVFTDISRDGTMTGCNIEATVDMARRSPHPVIASGGIARANELTELAGRGVYGAILGRSLYDGSIDLHEALKLLKNRQG